ncbi:MAG: hypothetical protein RIC38_10360 [Chromatocurvus sp.]
MLKPISCSLALLIAVSLAPGAQSREPAAPYGERIAAADAAWPEARPDPALKVFPDLERKGPVLVPDAAARESGTRWETQIRELEARGGPYAAGLEEPLADMARQRVEQGRFAEALSLYRRSLHVLRINTGLAGPAQLAIVRAMLQLQRAIGDGDALEDLYGYYYRLGWLDADTRSGEERWRVALEYLRWQRERLRTAGTGDVDRMLLNLHRLNEQLLEQAAVEDAQVTVQRDLARSQLLNLYLVRDRVAPPTPETLSVLAPRRSQRPDVLPEDIYRDRLLNLHRSAVRAGSELLESLVPGSESPVARAGIYRAIGDWEQWNGTWRRAEDAWRTAFQLLRGAGEEALIAQWFGAPVELPDNGVFWQPDDDGDNSVVRMTFDVSERGRPRRASASVLSGRDSATITAVRELRDMRFRPRFDSGQATDTASVVRDYRVYH